MSKAPKKTIEVKRITQSERRIMDLLYPEKNYWRPKTRGECENGIRPCPYVACKHNLYLDVCENGNIKFNFPDKEPWDMEDSCALDVAEERGAALPRVGEAMNLTGERVRQVLDPMKPRLRVAFGGPSREKKDQ